LAEAPASAPVGGTGAVGTGAVATGALSTGVARAGRLRLAFMGTPAFAVPSLEALLAAGHEVVCVYCQPPRPVGRGHKVQPSPVQVAAERHGLPVRTPTGLRDAAVQAEFAALDLDAAVVAAYGLILPRAMLAAPRHGCLNVHASLLPRWRGAAPIQRAVLAGDDRTGITIMAIEPGLDSGPMLAASSVPIGPATTAAGLHDTLAALGGQMIGPVLAGWVAGMVRAVPQPVEGVTHAAKLGREDGRLVWSAAATVVERTVRALTPWPGAWFEVDGVTIKVLAAEVANGGEGTESGILLPGTLLPGTLLPGTLLPGTLLPGTLLPGTLLDDRMTIVCGDGVVRLTLVQRPGRAAVDGGAFLRGCPWQVGERLGGAARAGPAPARGGELP